MGTTENTEGHEPQRAFDPRKQALRERSDGRIIKIAAIVVALAVVASLGYALLIPARADDSGPSAFAIVKRGKLTISVTEGGTLRAMESLELKSEVEGRNTIVELVDEGTPITEQDVEDGMVLVRLDSSSLEEREGNREISFYNAEASYTRAKENLDIQIKQNESNIAIAKLNLKFARMELDRYLGAGLAEQVLAEGFESIDLDALAQEEVDLILGGEQPEGAEPTGEGPPPAQGEVRLGGVARQELRDLSAGVQLAEEELTRAEGERTWSEELAAMQYISRNELVRDRLEAQRRKVAFDATKEALRLFRRYTLPKEVEQRYSDHIEWQRDLDRVSARARSQLAQSRATLKSSEASYELETERLDKVKLMLGKCVILAPKPGRVVYASTADAWRRMRNPVREGMNVHQNEAIITIPDLSTLAARVNIHETDIRKLQVGQRAEISVEAMPDKLFSGNLSKISPVASSAHAWLNPEIKVYEADIALDQLEEGLTPGMSATATIIVAELENVLYVPIEAVTTYGGRRVCLAEGPEGPQVREVETGYFTEKFVEIKDGLSEDQVVYLDPAAELGDEAWEMTPEAAQAERLIPESAFEREAGAEAPEEPAEAQEVEPAAESEYMTGGEVNWMKIGQEMQGLSDEEKGEKWQEILNTLPEEQRKQLEDAAAQWPSTSPQGQEEGGRSWGQ